MRIAIAMVLVACGKGGDKAEPPPAEIGLTKLAVTANGKPIAMAKAFVVRRTDGMYRVMLSEKDGSCSELLAGAKKPTVTIASQIDEHGNDKYLVRYVQSAGEPVRAKPSAAFVGTAAAAKGKPTPIQLDIAATDSELGIAMKGQFDAEGCGDLPLDGPPLKVAHPSTGAMAISTKRFAIAGATVHGDTIAISDVPIGCDSPPPSGVILTGTAGTWTLDGSRFPGQAVGDAPTLSIIPGASGTSDDGPTMQLALSGSAHLGDYLIALQGNVEALDCK
jgi:hypothetical protein